jgi:hypothetical protein
VPALGRQYLNAPFGGDVDKAIENFRKSTELDPNSDETFVWLAMALRKKGDMAGAKPGIGRGVAAEAADRPCPADAGAELGQEIHWGGRFPLIRRQMPAKQAAGTPS